MRKPSRRLIKIITRQSSPSTRASPHLLDLDVSDIKKLKGKAWVFGDILDVDFDICPIEATKSGEDRPKTEKDWGKYCMTNVDPNSLRKSRKETSLSPVRIWAMAMTKNQGH